MDGLGHYLYLSTTLRDTRTTRMTTTITNLNVAFPTFKATLSNVPTTTIHPVINNIAVVPTVATTAATTITTTAPTLKTMAGWLREWLGGLVGW